MGSGLILLVIVAAWLAVLVPMALRSHETTTSLSSVDRFSDAMRVLSRRDAAARTRSSRADRYGLGDDDVDDMLDDWDGDGAHGDGAHDDWAEGDWDGRDGVLSRVWAPVASAAGALVARLGGQRPAGVVTPAVRRRRLLVTMVALALAALVGGLLGPRVLLVAHGVLVVLVALSVVQLRRLAVRRATLSRRAEPTRPVPAPVSSSVRVAPSMVPVDVPVDVPVAPSEPAVSDEPLLDRTAEAAVLSTAARYDDPLPVAPAAALGSAWNPVPVPVPTYVTAPVAPPRAQRIVDLTRPGDWSAPPVEAEHPVGGEQAADDLGERRRAVNDW